VREGKRSETQKAKDKRQKTVLWHLLAPTSRSLLSTEREKESYYELSTSNSTGRIKN
jgi:hypothetical protein